MPIALIMPPRTADWPGLSGNAKATMKEAAHIKKKS
ncbi:MAG: hypothetical protein EFKGCFLK_01426 [Rhodocyclaceae bacterium]|nr:hypothetical protein [Rhodocyclaceae bacterium]CAG0928248.1 hypothetical protein RHDC3_00705 [Rhodocyclaceae bacterium]